MTRPFRTRLYLPVLLAIALAAACDFSVFGGDDEPPANARVVLSGSTSVPLELITSTDFELVRDSETGSTSTVFNASETDTVTVPLDRTYSIRPRNRFFVRLQNPDTIAATVQMQVFLGARKEYDAGKELQAGSPTGNVLEFTWFFF